MADIIPLDQIGPAGADLVGGKAHSLGHMTRAGLPVPRGFCVTSAAHRRLGGKPIAATDPLAAEIADAYERLGGGLVAVRSSAPAEDGTAASFAGQYETTLAVQGQETVIAAVGRCWESFNAARATPYRRRHGQADSESGLAVIIQRLVPSEVAGVLFTRDPTDPAAERMVVEAACGLGDAVVSGRVAPDRFFLDRETGRVLDWDIARKRLMSTPQGEREVAAEKQLQPCLDDARLAELADLGRRVERLFGDARDVEWAWEGGRFWLLQARPITAGAAERERVRREEIAALAALAEPGGTVWSRFSLSESLPEPTPMTWSLLRGYLLGRGLSRMYRDLGFSPDPALDEKGNYDLVCGRPFCNLSRMPRMQDRRLPIEHSFAALKANPAGALNPRAVLNPARAGWRFWLLLPLVAAGVVRSAVRLHRASRTFPRDFREEILPRYLQALEQEAAADLEREPPQQLLERLRRVAELTLCDYARHSLKPTVLASAELAHLERRLGRALGKERSLEAIGQLMSRVRPDAESDVAGAVEDLTVGTLDRATFLERFGHRAGHEMELSQPRWADDAAAVDRLCLRRGGDDCARRGFPDPVEHWLENAGLSPAQQAPLREDVLRLRTHLALRETGKHYLLKGYAEVRRILVELDRRFELTGGVFFLRPDELPELVAGADLGLRIRERRRRRALALSLEVPAVLFSDDLEAIGRPQDVPGADTLQGVPLSGGVAEGEALVLLEPDAAVTPPEGYILVCPSTDPAWVPWFVAARGLVMEAGGVLSHGAIVAREFGLPAVAGLPGVHRRLRTGQRLRVDGTTGRVAVLG